MPKLSHPKKSVIVILISFTTFASPASHYTRHDHHFIISQNFKINTQKKKCKCREGNEKRMKENKCQSDIVTSHIINVDQPAKPSIHIHPHPFIHFISFIMSTKDVTD